LKYSLYYIYLKIPLKKGFVQLLQYYYQKGCLYRLRALGEKADMDTTVGNATIYFKASFYECFLNSLDQ